MPIKKVHSNQHVPVKIWTDDRVAQKITSARN